MDIYLNQEIKGVNHEKENYKSNNKAFKKKKG